MLVHSVLHYERSPTETQPERHSILPFHASIQISDDQLVACFEEAGFALVSKQLGRVLYNLHRKSYLQFG